MENTLVIMAAGSGSRYGALKQFDQLGPAGEFLFEYAIFDAIQNGFQHIVLITREAYSEELRNYLSKRLPDNIRLTVLAQRLDDLPIEAEGIAERKKPWGTAHAVWTARNVVKGPFVVMNADDYYGKFSFQEAARFMEGMEMMDPFVLVPYSLDETLSEEGGVSRAICIIEDGFLHHIEEYLSISRKGSKLRDEDTGIEFTGKEVTSMNFWIFTPRVFDLIESDLKSFLSDPMKRREEELYIPRQVQQWIRTGRASVKLTAPCSDWFGVTYANDREKAVSRLEQLVSEGQYKSPLWK